MFQNLWSQNRISTSAMYEEQDLQLPNLQRLDFLELIASVWASGVETAHVGWLTPITQLTFGKINLVYAYHILSILRTPQSNHLHRSTQKSDFLTKQLILFGHAPCTPSSGNPSLDRSLITVFDATCFSLKNPSQSLSGTILPPF